jgi:mRNA-degrading endonuclease YafQ of YafQ-DinJ toxin-antitoxin module
LLSNTQPFDEDAMKTVQNISQSKKEVEMLISGFTSSFMAMFERFAAHVLLGELKSLSSCDQRAVRSIIYWSSAHGRRKKTIVLRMVNVYAREGPL